MLYTTIRMFNSFFAIGYAFFVWLPTAQADTLSFSYEELQMLTDDVMPLLDLIASGEGNYNSVNRGRAGDSPGDWPKKHLGKSITEMSIKEVRQHQGGRNPDCWYNGKKGKANLFAVGRYQLIPCTLKYTTESIEDLDIRMLYSPEVQDVFGVFLIFVKRPSVGKYLLGEHDDIKEAGQELAKEFASIPIQYSNGRCRRGQSYYCGDKAGNKAHIAIEDVNKALQQVRKNLEDHEGIIQQVEEKHGLFARFQLWRQKRRNRRVTITQPPTTITNMDHTLFDYINNSSETSWSIEAPPIELLQVPATNLTPPKQKDKPSDVQPPEPVPPIREVAPEPQNKSTNDDGHEEQDDDINDPRITPKK